MKASNIPILLLLMPSIFMMKTKKYQWMNEVMLYVEYHVQKMN
jgi:hypothetical protein